MNHTKGHDCLGRRMKRSVKGETPGARCRLSPFNIKAPWKSCLLSLSLLHPSLSRSQGSPSPNPICLISMTFVLPHPVADSQSSRRWGLDMAGLPETLSVQFLGPLPDSPPASPAVSQAAFHALPDPLTLTCARARSFLSPGSLTR